MENHNISETKMLSRGKRTDNHNWEYGYYCCIEKDGVKRHYIIPENTKEMYGVQVVPETIGMYIGLPDKNNTKVFDGDILKDTTSDEIYIIEVFNIAFGFYVRMVADDDYISFHDVGTNYDDTQITGAVVVGNIYDNPEIVTS